MPQSHAVPAPAPAPRLLLPTYRVSAEHPLYLVRRSRGRGYCYFYLTRTGYRVPLKSGGWNLHPRSGAGFHAALSDALQWGPSLPKLPPFAERAGVVLFRPDP